jgi:hypothetical protein
MWVPTVPTPKPSNTPVLSDAEQEHVKDTMLHAWEEDTHISYGTGVLMWHCVMDLQGPPSERTQMEKLRDLKKLAQHYARDWGSCDDTWISYMEFLEAEAEEDLMLARMIAG